MLRMIVLCLALVSSGVTAGYPDGSTGNTVGTGDSTSNAFGYGFSGSFDGSNPANIPAPIFDFQKFLTSYLEGINRYQQEFIRKGGGVISYSYAGSSPSGNAKASSSITLVGSNGLQALSAQAAQAGTAAGPVTGTGATGGAAGANSASVPSSTLYGTAGGFGGSTAFSGGGGGAGGGFGGAFAAPSGFGNGDSSIAHGGIPGSTPNLISRFGDTGAAFASGSVGPDGVQQSAAVFPENPNSPNINTRFAGSGEPGGFRSVFTSSQSHTTNVNGKPQTVQQASTTINDNGKVTTYTAKNP